MEQQKKKGMSKGCLVGLIVGGVLIVLMCIVVVTCIMKKDDLVKFGATTVVEQIKKIAVDNPQSGVDADQFAGLTDQFVDLLNTSDSVDFDQLALFVQTIQSIPADEVVDSIEAKQFIGAMIALYPELGDSYWDDETVGGDSLGVADSMAIE